VGIGNWEVEKIGRELTKTAELKGGRGRASTVSWGENQEYFY
jgi:hypothetical protein